MTQDFEPMEFDSYPNEETAAMIFDITPLTHDHTYDLGKRACVGISDVGPDNDRGRTA